MTIGAVPFRCTRCREEGACSRTRIKLHAQFVTADDATRRVNDDGVAGGGMFGIEWFLYTKRAAMFSAYQSGRIAIELES